MSQQQTTNKEYSNYYNKVLTKNKTFIDTKSTNYGMKIKESQSRQQSSNQFNPIRTKDFIMKDKTASTLDKKADQDDVNPSPCITISQDEIGLKKQNLTTNFNRTSIREKETLQLQNNLKQRNHFHQLKPSGNSQKFDSKSAGNLKSLLKFGGLKSSIQVQANSGQKLDFLNQTDTLRSSIHHNFSNETSPKVTNAKKIQSNMRNTNITDDAQQIYMKTQQKKQDDQINLKLSQKKPSVTITNNLHQKQKQQTDAIKMTNQIQQETKNQISRTVCSVQSTQSPIRQFQQFQEKQDKTLKKFGSLDCGQMIDFLHSQSVLQNISNQTQQMQDENVQKTFSLDLKPKTKNNEAVKKLEYQNANTLNNQHIPITNKHISQYQIENISIDNFQQQKQQSLQDIRSPFQIIQKRVPGSCLAGGAAIQKLSKLEAKDQDDVNDVTEDDDSDNNFKQKTDDKNFSQQNQPSITINNLLSLQSVPITNLQTQFNSPNNDYRNFVDNIQKKDKVAQFQKNNLTMQNQEYKDFNESLDLNNQNRKLRDEFIKVKQELEQLKQQRKQKIQGNLSGASLPLMSERLAVTQLKSPKNGPFEDEIMQRTGKHGQVVLTFGNKNVQSEQQLHDGNYTQRFDFVNKNNSNHGNNEQDNFTYSKELRTLNSENNIRKSIPDPVQSMQNVNNNIINYPLNAQIQENLHSSYEQRNSNNKNGSVTQRFEKRSNFSQKTDYIEDKEKINNQMQYQSIQAKKPPQHFVKTSNQDNKQSQKLKENAHIESKNYDNQFQSEPNNIIKISPNRNSNLHLQKNIQRNQNDSLDFNNQMKKLKQQQISSIASYNEIEVLDMTDEIASSKYKINLLKQQKDKLRTISTRVQQNSNSIDSQQTYERNQQKKQQLGKNNQKQKNSHMKSNKKNESIMQSIQEFKGSFQNKIRNEKKESISLYGATVGEQNISRKHFLHTYKKSFGSDYSKQSQDDQQVEYSASASNNSRDNYDYQSKSSQMSSEDYVQNKSDEKLQNYKIDSQYSQLASIRTKNRKRSIRNQTNPNKSIIKSNMNKNNYHNSPYQKIVEHSRNVNEEGDQAQFQNTVERINSKSKPIAHIDLFAENTNKKKDIKLRNSSLSNKNQNEASSLDEKSIEHSFYNQKSQSNQPQIQQNIIIDCQKQIQELQSQLKNLSQAQMPNMNQNSVGQQSLSEYNNQIILTPRDQQQLLLQQQHQLYQMYQQNLINQTSSPHTLQYSQNSGIQLTPFTPISNQNLINQTQRYLHQNQQPFINNQNIINDVMQFNQAAAFDEYELQIQYLQNQIRDQQLQLNMQDQKNQLLQRSTLNSPNNLLQMQSIHNFSDFQQNNPGNISSGFDQRNDFQNKNQNIFNNEKQKLLQSRHQSVVNPMNNSINTLSAFQAHQTTIQNQRTSQTNRMAPIQLQSGILYNDTQNQSNFFTQITDLGKNIEDDNPNHRTEQNDFEKQNQFAASTENSIHENKSRNNDYKNMHKTQEIQLQKDEIDQGQTKKQKNYSDFEMIDVDDQEYNGQKSKIDKDGSIYYQYMQDEYGKYEDEELRAGLKIDERQNQKESFAPSPDLLDQMVNFKEKQDFNQNQDFKTLKTRDFDELNIINESAEQQISPDFKFSKQYEENKTQNQLQEELRIQKLEKYIQNKKETLLVIGFDEQPRGINPLDKKRQNQSKQQDKKQFIAKEQEEYVTVKNIDRLSKIQGKQTANKNTIDKIQNSNNAIDQDNEQILVQQPQKVIMERKNKGELIIIQDDEPTLQSLAAKQRRGKLGEHFLRNQNKCESPQPRKSTAFNQDDNSNNIQTKPWKINEKDKLGQQNKRQEQSQQPQKSKENKSKEELAEIRKKWMKTKFRDREDPNNPLSGIKTYQPIQNNQDVSVNQQQQNIANQNDPSQNQKIRDKSIGQQYQDPKNNDLMLRLASGQKTRVDEKTMKKLTSKNYEKLPEIIKKKEMQKKQQELEERKLKYATYQKELKERMRNELIKKRSQIQPNQPKQTQGESSK